MTRLLDTPQDIPADLFVSIRAAPRADLPGPHLIQPTTPPPMQPPTNPPHASPPTLARPFISAPSAENSILAQHNMAAPLPDRWHHLDGLNLCDEFKLQIPTMEDVPGSIRCDFERIQHGIFYWLSSAYATTDDIDDPARTRGWKLFCPLSRMLLHRLR